jgi:hypothetical protein
MIEVTAGDEADFRNGRLSGIMYQHLMYNCFPPHPEMCDACVDAVIAVVGGDDERLIDLPENVADRRTGEQKTPAFRLIESFHLEDFIDIVEAEEF